MQYEFLLMAYITYITYWMLPATSAALLTHTLTDTLTGRPQHCAVTKLAPSWILFKK